MRSTVKSSLFVISLVVMVCLSGLGQNVNADSDVLDATRTPGPTRTSSPTRTITPTRTPSPTRTDAPPTVTRTASPTRTPSPTRTSSPTRTITPTRTASPTRTPSPTITPTPTLTPWIVYVEVTSTPRPATPTWTLTPSPTMTAGPTSQFSVGPIATVSVGEGMVEFGYVHMSMPAGSVNVILSGDYVSEYNPAYVTIHGQRLEVDFYSRTGDGSRFYKIAHFVNPLPFGVTYGDHVLTNVSDRQLPAPPLGLAPDGHIVQIDSLTGGLLRLYVQPMSICLEQNVRSIIVGDDTRSDPIDVVESNDALTSSGDNSCGIDVEISLEQTFYVGDNVTIWATGWYIP